MITRQRPAAPIERVIVKSLLKASRDRQGRIPCGTRTFQAYCVHRSSGPSSKTDAAFVKRDPNLVMVNLDPHLMSRVEVEIRRKRTMLGQSRTMPYHLRQRFVVGQVYRELNIFA